MIITMGIKAKLIALGSILIGLAAFASGCFLNSYQTAATIPPGELIFWWGLGGPLTPDLGFIPQIHVRYGLMPRLDVGLGTGLLLHRDLQGITFLGLVGDLRYQLRSSPDISIGLMPGDFPLLGETLSGGAVYLSQTFGPLTPYGVYRFRLLLREGGLSFSQQATIGLEILNRPRLPAILEISWQDGLLLWGFAIRF